MTACATSFSNIIPEGKPVIPDDAMKPASLEAPKSPASSELPNQFCPICSSRLESHRCKMICRQCGYFMSCSEFE